MVQDPQIPDRKEQIAEVALHLADTLGPERVSTTAVAQVIGISQPALFKHFPSKGAIWQAVARLIVDRMEDAWKAAAAEEADAMGRLRRLVHSQLSLVQRAPGIPAILFSRELHARDTGLRQVFFELTQRFRDVIEAIVAEGQAAGTVTTASTSRDIATLVQSMIHGTVLRWSLSGKSFDLPTEGVRMLDLQVSRLAATSETGISARAGADRCPSPDRPPSLPPKATSGPAVRPRREKPG